MLELEFVMFRDSSSDIVCNPTDGFIVTDSSSVKKRHFSDVKPTSNGRQRVVWKLENVAV